ncbi:hypothetical protein Droror1_Dr00011985 [Drosera rotundifolia]
MASMMSSTTVATRTVTAQAAVLAAPHTTSKVSMFPGMKKRAAPSSAPAKSGVIKMMQVYPPIGLKKFETFSYLPPLDDVALAKEVDYLLRNGWVPCLEFETVHGFIFREHNRSPGYYDGRYWTMWKLPMFGCTDSSQVLAELEEAKKAYPNAFIRILGFDAKRQVQCVCFIAYKPPVY